MSTLYYDSGPAAAKVMLATTAYDSPDAGYTFSMAQSRQYLASHGVDTDYLLLSGDCHVDDARNRVVAHFLGTDCKALVFIDADVVWEAKDLLAIIEAPGDIVGGVYPHRLDGGDRGEFPAAIAHPEECMDQQDRMLLMEHLPTGFMRISREVLEHLADDAEHYAGQDGKRTPCLFRRRNTPGAGGTLGRIGGDVGFCRNAIDEGFEVYALPEIVLGHAMKAVRYDSLAAMLRWKRGTVLSEVCDLINAGEDDVWHYREAREWVGNRWGCAEHSLAFAAGMARKADAPILELGSGLSTVLMAAATDQMVFAVEHDPLYAEITKRLAYESGYYDNIAIVNALLRGGWYDLSEVDGLPDQFAFAFVDGPPRQLSDRAKFFETLADRCAAILCDDADTFGDAMTSYADRRGWQTLAQQGRAMLIGKDQANG